MTCLHSHHFSLFFESLYETLIDLVDEAFHRMQKRGEIEYEIGQIFRSKHFNLYKRKNLPARSECLRLLGIVLTRMHIKHSS